MSDVEDRMREIANFPDDHPYFLGEPLYMKKVEGHHQDPMAYIPVGFTKSAWGNWWAEVSPADDLSVHYEIPVEWLTNVEDRSGYRAIRPFLKIIQGGKS